jgi:UDP-glucuronate 4-epimerase
MTRSPAWLVSAVLAYGMLRHPPLVYAATHHRGRLTILRHHDSTSPELVRTIRKHSLSCHNLHSDPTTDNSNNNIINNNKMNTANPLKPPSALPSEVSTTDSDTSVSSSSTWEHVDLVEPHVGKKTVLVTGGAGFIGSSVAALLLERGDNVVIVDEINDYYSVDLKNANLALLKSKYGSDRLKVYVGDICDTKLVEQIFETERPEWVCHMAARAGVRPSIQDPFVYIHSNIKGTTQLMELSARYGVKNFVFASSSSVYGGSKSAFFSEDEAVDHPVSPYAASKKACELLAYTYHHLYKLNVSALRFFTVYGPRGRPDMAPFKFVDRVSRGLTLQQYGDGSSSRDYTYIDDIVDGVVRAVDRPYPYQIFNLGKGSGTSLSEFISLVQKHVGKPAKIEVLPDQPGDVPYTCADVSKAERLLGYVSKVSFEEGIERTVDWYREAYGIPQDTALSSSSPLKLVNTVITPTVSTVN